MKFKVRAGYACHVERSRHVEQNGRKVKQTTTSSHYEGEIVDLAPEEVADHLAKLEPADKEASAFLSTAKAA